jgi:uncharacterized membrane protein
MSIHKVSTNCVYTIDDSTGRMEARHWLATATEVEAGKWADLRYEMIGILIFSANSHLQRVAKTNTFG